MLEIRITTPKETTETLKNMPTEIRQYLREGMEDGFSMLEDEVKRSFGRPGYPRVVTGNLRASIYHRIRETRNDVIGILGASEEYGLYLEEGTNRMPAKPFLRPTYEKNQERLNKIILDTIERRFNQR